MSAILTDQSRRNATGADVWNWRLNGCTYAEIAEYTGRDESVVRALEAKGQKAQKMDSCAQPVDSFHMERVE